MARLSLPIADYVRAYGPHVTDSPAHGWAHKPPVERLVKTHCCFCGMQCGIQLQVADNKVVGFEPWDEFPFNEGRLCPKGVKRYMQTHHPDRLTAPLDPHGRGFREASWDEALALVVDKVRAIQGRRGKDAFAMMSGVSLSNEKSYLVGKFARLALNTANLDYNGRFCMVSAGAGNKKAFGIDRSANPWTDLPEAELLLIAGSNVSECFPTLMHYIWQARDRGARIIVVDPRITPIGRTADLHLAVRPGTDSALNQALLHELIEHGWVNEPFVRERCSGWAELAASVAACTPAWAETITGVPADQIRAAARMVGAGEDQLPAPRARRGAAHQGRGQRAVAHQPGAGDGAPRSQGLRLRHDHRAGQRPGRPRARAQVRPAPRQSRHREPGPSRARLRRVGHHRRGAAAQGHHGGGDLRGDPRRPHRRHDQHLLQPDGEPPRRELRARGARAARVPRASSTSS